MSGKVISVKGLLNSVITWLSWHSSLLLLGKYLGDYTLNLFAGEDMF